MSQTVILTSSTFDHHTRHNHVEHAERLVAIRRAITQSGLQGDLHYAEVGTARDEDLEAVHQPRMLAQVRQLAHFGGGRIDADTYATPDSWEVASLAAGAAVGAVELVVGNRARNAFALLRPPGHHATPSQAMGFCLINNVAVAARYALRRLVLSRVAIVDFDVHHGNGTQDIFYEDRDVYYYSLHQYPWYPGTGGANERGRRAGEGTTLNVPIQARTPSASYLRSFRQGLERIAAGFSPDLILVSAGFDAHESDPLGDLLLTDDCYHTMTRELRDLARATADGRIVSCLEGGYNLTTLGGSVLAHLRAFAD